MAYDFQAKRRSGYCCCIIHIYYLFVCLCYASGFKKRRILHLFYCLRHSLLSLAKNETAKHPIRIKRKWQEIQKQANRLCAVAMNTHSPNSPKCVMDETQSKAKQIIKESDLLLALYYFLFCFGNSICLSKLHRYFTHTHTHT